MGSGWEDLLPKLILQMGQSLDSTTRKTAGNTRDVAALCNHVAPDIVRLRMALAETGASALLGYLQILLDLKIPANLVKLMTLSLRAGYPMAQPSAAAKESCDIASNMWALAAELFREILLVCQTHPGEPNHELCKAVYDQMQTLTSDGDPGEELYLLVSALTCFSLLEARSVGDSPTFILQSHAQRF